jgi:hypothetical protein
MSREQIVALLYHEMRHIQIVEGKFAVVCHDIEDWVPMIQKLGADWSSEDRKIPDLLDDSVTDWSSIEGRQQTLFSEAPLRRLK